MSKAFSNGNTQRPMGLNGSDAGGNGGKRFLARQQEAARRADGQSDLHDKFRGLEAGRSAEAAARDAPPEVVIAPAATTQVRELSWFQRLLIKWGLAHPPKFRKDAESTSTQQLLRLEGLPGGDQ